MAKYLYPRARTVEVMTAMYAGGLGLFIGLNHAFTGIPPLVWTGFSEEKQITLAFGFVVAALIHASGIRLNGDYPRTSSSLRLFGMGVHCVLIAVLAARGVSSTAGYTYVWILSCLLIGCTNAARDAIHAYKTGLARWKTN